MKWQASIRWRDEQGGKGENMKAAASFDRHLIDLLRDNEKFREGYLNEAINEQVNGVSLAMFRNVAEALGGVTKLAKHSGLNRKNLYRALSGERDPAFSTVEGIVHGLGFNIKVEPMNKPALYGPARRSSKKPPWPMKNLFDMEPCL
jgi:probable addiction module antidote protein